MKANAFKDHLAYYGYFDIGISSRVFRYRYFESKRIMNYSDQPSLMFYAMCSRYETRLLRNHRQPWAEFV